MSACHASCLPPDAMPGRADERRRIVNDTPDRARREGWSRLSSPFVLALIPAVAAIVVAVITISPKSDSPSPPPVTRVSSDVSYRIEPDLNLRGDGWKSVFDGPLPSSSGLPSKDDYAAAYQWASTRGAVDVGESFYRLQVVNNGAERLTIQAIRANVIDRASPMNKTSLSAPSAGATPLVSLLFDLDTGDRVDAQKTSGFGLAPQGSYFDANDVTLNPGETQQFKLSVVARTCLCHYKFELDILKGTAAEQLEIADELGHPFAITGPAASYNETWTYATLECRTSRIVAQSGGPDGPADCSRPSP